LARKHWNLRRIAKRDIMTGMETILDSLVIALEHHHAGRLSAAEQVYRQILARDPHQADAWHLLGVVEYQFGNYLPAAEYIDRAIALQPLRAEFHCNLGAVKQALGTAGPAVACYRRAIELNPQYATAHSNLGNVFKDLGQLDDAVACYQRALQLQPGMSLVHNNLAVALSGQGRLEDAIVSYRQALDLDPESVQTHSNLLYTLNFCPGYDAQRIYQEHRLWDTRHAKPLVALIRAHLQDRTPDRRLRVGYVSPDVRRHPVGLFLLPLLACHDPERFQIYCYSSVAIPDEITERCRSHVQVWRNVFGQTDEQVAEAIRGDQIDILVDLAMHMPGNRLLVFARKPAPVQVTYLAYCGTTGLDSIDYRLTDPYLDPPDHDDRIYSEESIRLPETYWCYPDRGDSPGVGRLPADQAGHITFGCLNNFCKVTAPTLTAWVRLLAEMPEATLLLHAHPGSHRDRLRSELVRHGISGDRLDFAGYLPTAEYLRTYERIDIALDPFPLGGGTTTCDALWMGAPVVTMAGETAVGRSGLSILSNVGLADLVARDAAEYVQIALNLARDKPRLAALRRDLRDKMRKSPVMDAPRFARNVEAAYRRMWQRWCTRCLSMHD
jgi:predicted O-linked N-acetylglucosamine transferase (SPINDLY family)